ncbi:MAG: SulP family inorganic anion transporter, partial [Gammaproteobacteria bacterium]|nr:SulP family inorganic anion transporter [Gammaproteobacteria bacterium]
MEENPFGKLTAVVRAAFSKRTLLAVTVGLVSGVTVIVGEISLATLIFSGPLAAYTSEGVGLVLFGCFVACLVLALTSGFKGAVSAPPVPTLIVLAVLAGALTVEGEALFATMVAIVVVCALATGLCTWLIGRFQLANLIRFIPYPVSSGFVAGTGGVACLVAFSLMGVDLEWAYLSALLEPLVAVNLGLGLAYGVGLYLATKRWSNFLLLPISFPVTAVLCHLGLALFGVSEDESVQAGILFAGISEGRLWPGFGLEDVALVDWAAVAHQVPNMLTLVLVTLLCVVMYVGGLEVAANRDLDWNHEFRSVGLAGVLGGLGGAPPGCMVVPTSMRSLIFGVDMRFTGIVAALAIGSTLLVGDALLKLVPVPLMGGVLLFTGIVMVEEWLVKIRKRIPATDYAIIVVMFITITTLGFFEGVGVGMAITIVFFVIRMSRAQVIGSRYTARDRRSKRLRPIPERAILQTAGKGVQAYGLTGYVFFGTGYPLADRLKASLGDEAKPRCVLLDCEAVSGFDFSSINALGRFMRAAHGAGTRVVVGGASAGFSDELRRNLPPPVFDNLQFEPSADLGLERCEDIVIEDYLAAGSEDGSAALLETVADAMSRQLDRRAWFEELVGRLGDWAQGREYEAGETIVAMGMPCAGVQMMTAGRASVYDASGTRLDQCGPGDVV